MTDLRNLSTADLRTYRVQVNERYEAFRAQKHSLNLGRGKPSPEQLDLSNGLLSVLGSGDFLAADGTDCRNYGGLQGLAEARALFGAMLEIPGDRVLVAGNSSLELMHDTVEWASLRGVPGSAAPWSASAPATFLCPVPGYDRHFTICDGFGIRMVPVPLTGHGPDMDVVERLVASDPTVKGMWCVPKYSNPTGEVYSDEVAERLAQHEDGSARLPAVLGQRLRRPPPVGQAPRDREHHGALRASWPSRSGVRVRVDVENDICRRRRLDLRLVARQHEVDAAADGAEDHRVRQAESAAPRAVSEGCGRHSTR